MDTCLHSVLVGDSASQVRAQGGHHEEELTSATALSPHPKAPFKSLTQYVEVTVPMERFSNALLVLSH